MSGKTESPFVSKYTQKICTRTRTCDAHMYIFAHVHAHVRVHENACSNTYAHNMHRQTSTLKRSAELRNTYTRNTLWHIHVPANIYILLVVLVTECLLDNSDGPLIIQHTMCTYVCTQTLHIPCSAYTECLLDNGDGPLITHKHTYTNTLCTYVCTQLYTYLVVLVTECLLDDGDGALIKLLSSIIVCTFLQHKTLAVQNLQNKT